MGIFKIHDQQFYRIRIEKSLILTLCLIIFIFLLFPTYQFNLKNQQAVYINIEVQDIPITKQGVFRPPPPRPAVPIPTEDECIPDDETIEITNLELNLQPLASSGSNKGFGSAPIVPPRPIVESFPEFPEEDYKNGVTGTIKLHVKIDESGKVTDVVVLENTTGSKRCAQAAIQAAYRWKYFPGRSGNTPKISWITQNFSFNIPD